MKARECLPGWISAKIREARIGGGAGTIFLLKPSLKNPTAYQRH
jgi:hypothetical protein